MGASAAIILFCGALWTQPTEPVLIDPAPRFRVDLPATVLTNVPISQVVITAQTPDGNRDVSYQGRPLIRGIRLTIAGRETALPAFEDGTLTLATHLAAGRRVYVSDDEITIEPESGEAVTRPVPRIWRWFTLLPPVVAIGLAMWIRNVLPALLAGIFCGALVLMHGNLALAFAATFDLFVLEQLLDRDHMLIMLFTTCLGAMIGVMWDSGASSELVNRLARVAERRERGQLLTMFMGLLVFFDDYANSLLVGPTMKPVTDRLRISREKLAFLVDSTAAPIAGLALVSTWVGFEVGQINDGFRDLNIETNAFSVFLGTWFYRFYPILLLVFVWLIAMTGNDFGPMLKAEARALALGQVSRPGAAITDTTEAEPYAIPTQRPLIRNAVIPLIVLVLWLAIGTWWSGRAAILETNAEAAREGRPLIPLTVAEILGYADGNRMLFMASLAASGAAVFCSIFTRALSLGQAVDAWVKGARSMFLALLILLLAWGVAAVCNTQNLNTAGFLVELSYGSLAVQWMPALVFVLAAVIAFATGSSFSTMGLLMPLAIAVTYHLLVPLNEAAHAQEHHLMLATVGAVLAGAILGDHCSPISDTTVLSSAASSCDHMDHVTTQMPYALTVGAVSLVFGYLPVGLGFHPIVLLPLATLVIYLIVQFAAASAEDHAKQIQPLDGEIDL